MGGQDVTTARISYTEIFEDAFPMYLVMGVSYEQYWEGDPQIVAWYRKAYDLQKDTINQWLWINGMYQYTAHMTALGNAFRGKGQRAQDYLKQPLPIREQTEREKKVANKRKVDNLISMFEGQKRYLDNKKKQEVKNNGNP